MCHLCRKVELLGGYDYKATKPVFLAVSKLHKHVQPHLGDLWLLRHDETARLRKLLGGLHKVVPVAALREVINEIDNEMRHIKKQMSEHPPQHSMGHWEELKGSITPSESPSVRISRQRKLKAKRRSRDGAEKSIKKISRSKVEKSLEASPELSGSDLYPPHRIVAQSIKRVQDWLDMCDLAMDSEYSEETESLVSLLGGGVVARPAFQVSFWRRSSITTAIANRLAHSRLTNRVRRTSDCVYDRPFKMMELDSDTIARLNKGSTDKQEKAPKNRFAAKLPAFLRRKKTAKQETINKKIASNTDTTQHSEDGQEGYEDWEEALMRGGRSSGGNASILAIAPASMRNSSRTERHSQAETASTLSNINDSRPEMSTASQQTGSDPTMSSELSSRLSKINFGSIIERPISPSELADQERREMQREKSPEIFVPTTPEPIQQQVPRSSTAVKQLRRKPSFPSFRPSTPKPMEQTYNSPSKATQALRPVSETLVQEPGGFIREKMQLADAGQGVSIFAANRESRRADRTSDSTSEFHKHEGQAAGVHEGALEFTKNRERRRAARNSVGSISEKKGAGAGKTSSTEKKRTKTTKGFNVDEEEVASGAAWERRVKKAQANSKKPASEKYRAEERQK